MSAREHHPHTIECQASLGTRCTCPASMKSNDPLFAYRVELRDADGFVRKSAGFYFYDEADKHAALWSCDERTGDGTYIIDEWMERAKKETEE